MAKTKRHTKLQRNRATRARVARNRALAVPSKGTGNGY